MKVYKVGGAVRDKLLGLPVTDYDWVVVGSTPEQMLTLGYLPVGKEFPVFLHPTTKEEYALARTERKNGRGYRGFSFYTDPSISLEEDLKRRDLTVNAMAEDIDGRLIDPYGGQRDLADRMLRHVSAAFVEDPLRVLRVARLAARFNFQVADKTIALMREISRSEELLTLSAERVWTELKRALQTATPARFIETLHDVGALKTLFPEIECLFGVPQPAKYHPEIDTGIHTLMVLTEAAKLSEDTKVRFAALVHDLGKGNTPKDMWPHHHGHEERGVKIIKGLCKRYKIPKDHRDLAELTSRYHLLCHRIYELKAKTVVKILEQMDAFRRSERFYQFLTVCESDARGRTNFTDKNYPQATYFYKLQQCVKTASYDDQAHLSGKEIAKAIQKKRISILEKAIEIGV